MIGRFCKDCCWYDDTVASHIICRRSAPDSGGWPRVSYNEWCGDIDTGEEVKPKPKFRDIFKREKEETMPVIKEMFKDE